MRPQLNQLMPRWLAFRGGGSVALGSGIAKLLNGNGVNT